ncbi:MAG: hypothetical protein H0U74_01060 [Bradymonadaceae bacterium]|nr:hypothetical protein [Lujinxingiaceae bacterium]
MINRLPFRAASALLAIVMLTTLASSASADDLPYSPKNIARAELIDLGYFKRSPLKLPWLLVSVTTVSRNGRMDFEHVYDEPYERVVAYFQHGYDNREPVVPLAKEMARYSSLTDLRVVGMQVGANEATMTLGVPGLPRHFTIHIGQRGYQTTVVFVNAANTMEYSGVMPARAPLRPAGAKTVPFRWN